MQANHNSLRASPKPAATTKAPLVAGYVALLALALSGCWEERVDTTYGERAGVLGGESVNGTAVLSQMFQQNGHRVLTKRYLTDALMDNSNVIVWIPDDFEPPSPQVIRWFDEWLWKGGRTLIYVGRDYSAGPLYYDKVLPTAPANQAVELRRRQTEAQSEFAAQRGILTGKVDCDWFQIDANAKQRSVTTLAGPWSDSIDPTKVDIELHSRLKPKVFEARHEVSSPFVDFMDDEWEEMVSDPDESTDSAVTFLDPDAPEILLRSGKDILVSRQQYDDTTNSHLIFVANGSFVLNFPLVNHEHRKIASRLVGEIQQPETVVFIESDAGGPKVVDKEPPQNVPTGLALFTQRPFDVILFQLTLLGLVFCLSRWPIFGRWRRPPPETKSDFGKHVDAYGELLQQTGDRHFAETRLRQYQETIAAD